MEKLSLILKNAFAGLAIIAIIFTICFFLVGKFYSGHAHGLPGVLTVMIGALTAVIFTVTAIVLVFMGKSDFNLALKIATGLGVGFGIISLFIEL